MNLMKEFETLAEKGDLELEFCSQSIAAYKSILSHLTEKRTTIEKSLNRLKMKAKADVIVSLSQNKRSKLGKVCNSSYGQNQPKQSYLMEEIIMEEDQKSRLEVIYSRRLNDAEIIAKRILFLKEALVYYGKGNVNIQFQSSKSNDYLIIPHLRMLPSPPSLTRTTQLESEVQSILNNIATSREIKKRQKLELIELEEDISGKKRKNLIILNSLMEFKKILKLVKIFEIEEWKEMEPEELSSFVRNEVELPDEDENSLSFFEETSQDHQREVKTEPTDIISQKFYDSKRKSEILKSFSLKRKTDVESTLEEEFQTKTSSSSELDDFRKNLISIITRFKRIVCEYLQLSNNISEQLKNSINISNNIQELKIIIKDLKTKIIFQFKVCLRNKEVESLILNKLLNSGNQQINNLNLDYQLPKSISEYNIRNSIEDLLGENSCKIDKLSHKTNLYLSPNKISKKEKFSTCITNICLLILQATSKLGKRIVSWIRIFSIMDYDFQLKDLESKLKMLDANVNFTELNKGVKTMKMVFYAIFEIVFVLKHKLSQINIDKLFIHQRHSLNTASYIQSSKPCKVRNPRFKISFRSSPKSSISNLMLSSKKSFFERPKKCPNPVNDDLLKDAVKKSLSSVLSLRKRKTELDLFKSSINRLPSMFSSS